jgi:hypothetical protein
MYQYYALKANYILYNIELVWIVGVQRNLQLYFSYIVLVIFIVGDNQRPAARKLSRYQRNNHNPQLDDG